MHTISLHSHSSLQACSRRDDQHPHQTHRRPAGSKPHVLAQRYISDPLLINGCKFGLRLWVLVSGLDPFTAYLHGQGLVLFSTDRYAWCGVPPLLAAAVSLLLGTRHTCVSVAGGSSGGSATTAFAGGPGLLCTTSCTLILAMCPALLKT